MLSLLICSSVVISNSFPAFAYSTFNDHVFTGGVSNLTYSTEDDSVNSYIESTMKSAANSWNNTNCGVSLTETAKHGSANIIFYYDEDLTNAADDNAGVIAFTKFYLTNSKWVGGDSDNHSGPTSNWSKSHIIINPSVYNTLSTSVKTASLAHELGHAFGLAHSNDRTVLMYPSSARTVYTPQIDDTNGIIHLYGSRLTSSKSTNLSTPSTLNITDTTTSSAVTADETDFSYVATLEDCLKNYSDVNELTNDSNTIIQGEIQDKISSYDKSGIFTDVKIKVTNNLAGTLKAGDVISVRLRGGTIAGEDAKGFRMQIMKADGITSDNVSSDKITEVIDGSDNFNKGDSSLFFLNCVNNKYYVTGSHQGKFKLTNDSVQLHDKLKSKYGDLKKEDFIKDIKNAVLNKKEK